MRARHHQRQTGVMRDKWRGKNIKIKQEASNHTKENSLFKRVIHKIDIGRNTPLQPLIYIEQHEYEPTLWYFHKLIL